ncbi:hypothetical protein ICL81_04795 [Leucobacter sp. cx-328]|uniref:hypothetical protein n=1 Tax=unclassified Leucobacter TaxID=2621730 RepID=UPI00165EA023|nr:MULTISPECIES: hypothetical protein [unclassified Leucobacter]MBC9943844.1 hypothetical protein [Leucobacter sp. cx-328]
MKMSLVVGFEEKHLVEFSFDEFWGGIKITVDGVKVMGTVQILSFSTMKAWEITVGTNEQHHVRFEKRRAQFFAAFKPQPVRVYVDGIFIMEAFE